MFNIQTYDAFVLVPYYLGMYHKQDVHIRGVVSEKFYKNIVTYIQKILLDFSDDLSPVQLNVDGFGNAECSSQYIGTGISCGVDSLCTIYDHFIKEESPQYKINSLFIFNCGTHGDFENEETQKIFENRCRLNKGAADEMGLSVIEVNSNLHAFTHKIGEQKVGYFAIYSCIFSLQKVIKRYYVSSTYSYRKVMKFGFQSHDFDMAEFCESYLVPLIQTETLELVSDGCQYERSEKTERISDWDIARKYLNVCVIPEENAKNCSHCSKCMRTLIALEAMGKLEKFSDVFDIDIYKKYAWKGKVKIVADYGREGFATDNVDFARNMNLKLPSRIAGNIFRICRMAKRMARHLKRNS